VKRARRKNPPLAGKTISAAAVKRFQTFFDFDPRKVISFPVPSRKIPGELVILGTLELVGYISDKWEGKNHRYLHEFKKGARPFLCCDAAGKQLFIIGGDYAIKEEGIVD